MRGKAPGTELENLSRGLGSAEDPYQIKELLKRGIEDLADEVEKRIRYTAIEMVNQGRYFVAIKEKLKHGEWEPFMQKRKWSPFYVRTCMKLLDVVAKFPQALHLPPGRVTHRLLNLPMPEIENLLDGAPPETIGKLTSWDLEHIYNKNKLQIEPPKPRKKKPLPPDFTIPDFDSRLIGLFIAAKNALMDLAEYKIDLKYRDQASETTRDLALAWEKAIYNLSDPEHRRKPPWEMTAGERGLAGFEDEEGRIPG